MSTTPQTVTWEVASYQIEGSTPTGAFAASVSNYDFLAADHDGNTWHAQCSGPGKSVLSEWFATADEAKAAVMAHIAGGAR